MSIAALTAFLPTVAEAECALRERLEQLSTAIAHAAERQTADVIRPVAGAVDAGEEMVDAADDVIDVADELTDVIGERIPAG